MNNKEKSENNTSEGFISSRYGIDYQNLIPALLKVFWCVGTEETKKLNTDNALLQYYPSDENIPATIKIFLPDNEDIYSLVAIIDLENEIDLEYDDKKFYTPKTITNGRIAHPKNPQLG